MKVIPHGRQFIGFFDQLDGAALVRHIQSLVLNKEEYFSFGIEPEKKSVINCFFNFIAETETLTSDTFDEESLQECYEQILTGKWSEAKISIEHGLLSPNLGIRMPGRHNDEHFEVEINCEDDTCQLKCRFREVHLSDAFLSEVIKALDLSDKPKKYSRDLPLGLETKMLCDSMHLCNICRDEGVIIHHIKPVEDGGKTVYENLIVICLNCHRKVHTKSKLSKNIKPEHLREYKKRHSSWVNERGSAQLVGYIAILDEGPETSGE